MPEVFFAIIGAFLGKPARVYQMSFGGLAEIIGVLGWLSSGRGTFYPICVSRMSWNLFIVFKCILLSVT